MQHYSAARTISESKAAAYSAPASPVSGNILKSAHRKQKLKRNNRPGTSESSKRLLGPGPEFDDTESINDGQSDIYHHYRSSLVSLSNIVDNVNICQTAHNSLTYSAFRMTGSRSSNFTNILMRISPSGTGINARVIRIAPPDRTAAVPYLSVLRTLP